MLSNRIEWINQEEAAKMVGLPSKTLQRYVREGKLLISFTKVSRKAKMFYSKADLEHLLFEKAVLIGKHV
jgi:predicted site-specific integrase-resolvase